MRTEQGFEGSPASVRSARGFVAATLEAWDLCDVSAVACLLTSELAANAVRHAATAYRVTLELVPPELRIEVSDGSTTTPVRLCNDDESGKGLVLVEALAERWGTRVHERGKAVWVTLLLPEASASFP
jgi:two-component sensor histidine kinase